MLDRIAVLTITAIVTAFVTTVLALLDVVGYEDAVVVMLLAVVLAILGTKET
jgi:hypothetical protein